MMRQILAAALMVICAPSFADSPLPFALGGPFELVDQHGDIRTQVNPEGTPQLLFFGYANCPGICTAAMPLMAQVVDAMKARDVAVRPLMITVDPARDTVETMADPLANYHPDFVGLTGDTPALEAAYKAFSVDRKFIYDDPEYGPVYSHGSLIFLLDAEGTVLTIIPPVADADKAIEIAWRYIGPKES